MNKDALLATFIGFLVGLIVTGIILYGPNIASGLPKFQMPKFSLSLPQLNKPKPTPASTPAVQSKEHAVSVESPLPEAIEQTSTVLVSGTTSADATVIISGGVDEAVIVSNADGKYAGKITLSEGKNDITVTSIKKPDGIASHAVTVFYTPEEW